VAVVLTLLQTKQIRINIHKRNNTENAVQTIQNTVNISTQITKTSTHYKTHTLKKEVKTTAVQHTSPHRTLATYTKLYAATSPRLTFYIFKF